MKILLFGEPALRQKAKPVTVFHRKLQNTIDSMADTLKRREDGAAVAAPQLGILKRIVVIDYEGEYLELINPEITASSGEQTDYEGCLSLPGYFGRVKRFEKVSVKYLDRCGKEHQIERSGKMARCLQHEIDHLDGILFVDRMTDEYLINSDDDEKISVDSVLAAAG